MNTNTENKIPATAVRVGTVFADGATVCSVGTNLISNKRGTYICLLVTLPGGTLKHRRMMNIAGTQTVTIP